MTGATMPAADPQLLLAIISAAMQAVQTWLSFRDRKQASTAAASAYQEAGGDPRTAAEADALRNLVPPDILARMTGRVSECWDKYSVVLADGNDYLPAEVDDATTAVQACICRELKRIHRLNKRLPEGQFTRWWDAYCVKPT